jgi:hypothetical protein
MIVAARAQRPPCAEIIRVTGHGREATLMEPDSNLAPQTGRTPRLGKILKAVLLTIFVILLFLLGQSMVHNRFFRGGRVHQNGSVGQ